MLDEFVGLTSARGSGSAFGKSTLPSTDSWSATLSAVQPENGVGPGSADESRRHLTSQRV